MKKKPLIVDGVEEEKGQHKNHFIFSTVLRRRRIIMGVLLSFVIIGLGLGLGLTLTNGHDTHGKEGEDATVDLGYSKYRGKAFSDGISHWLGMRYAAPPLGSLRFAAPQDPKQNSTVQAADAHGARCLGTRSSVTDKPIAAGTSEDCLFVDVYAPTKITKTSKLPVYLFIQGGGFNDNAGANLDGKDLVKISGMGIVVVNFNYRVGPYGFLASSEVQAKASLNNGLKDQRQVLHWIQVHISKFGGDPGHVVMGGASAGAASVTLQLAAYGGRNDGLFHGTISESQSFGALRTVPESQYQYDELVARTKCTAKDTGNHDTLSCLRRLDIKVLQKFNVKTKFPNAKKLPIFAYNPTLDYDFIKDYTIALFETGRFVRVPAIYGDVTDEGTIFVPKDVNTVQDSKDFVQAQFPVISAEHLDDLEKLYPPGQKYPDAGKYWHSTSAAYGELRYVCPGIHLSNIYSAKKIKGNYNYRYNVVSPSALKSGVGVPHVAELGVIWNHNNNNEGLEEPHKAFDFNANIPRLMQKYWVSFVMTLDPNKLREPGSPFWGEWTAPTTQATTQEGGGGGGETRRLVVQSGVNASTMESVPLSQKSRCDVLQKWFIHLKQ